MIEQVKASLASQYEAAFLTLQSCLDHCPEESWTGPVANRTFDSAFFHALFYGDLYLGQNIECQRQQAFHQANENVFGDYEELEHREPVCRYQRADVQSYLDFCREKAKREVANDTEESLQQSVGFPWLAIKRLEMHVYNIRHLQHHAAQLILRLRLDHNPTIDWVRDGSV